MAMVGVSAMVDEKPKADPDLMCRCYHPQREHGERTCLMAGCPCRQFQWVYANKEQEAANP